MMIGAISLYAGIWSLHAGISTQSVIVSSIDNSIWLICGVNLVGFVAATTIKEKSSRISGWILCICEIISALLLVTFFYDPHYLFYFIIPILFCIILLDFLPSTILISGMILVSISLFYFNTQSWAFLREVALPVILLLTISILLELVFSQIYSNLTWYHQRYQKALLNEQIIRENEIKLEKLVNNLKDIKGYLSASNISLIQARDEAEQARKVKQNFVQNVSHELRTPLNLIIGFSETMVNSPQSYGEVNWTPDLRGDIECIYQNSQHLKALIDDILDMASLENKKYEIEVGTVDLNSLVKEVIFITENAYKSKNLHLDWKLSRDIRSVRGDSIRLKQVLLNLLSNALKYTAHGGVLVATTIHGKMATVTVKRYR